MFIKDEWTQQELYKYTKEFEPQGINIVLIDTILKPLEKIETMTYNPYEMGKMPTSTIFVFYCDTGKMTKERLNFYKNKLPNHRCVSLRGGRAYWRPNYSLEAEIQKSV